MIELPNPSPELREKFLRARLADTDEDTLMKLVSLCENFSFAHLQEILRLSGFLALHEARESRRPSDLLHAAEMVREANDTALRGFPVKLEMPFGLAPKRSHSAR
jgi:ATP-dependent 26S proteasome regulatory subunit